MRALHVIRIRFCPADAEGNYATDVAAGRRRRLRHLGVLFRGSLGAALGLLLGTGAFGGGPRLVIRGGGRVSGVNGAETHGSLSIVHRMMLSIIVCTPLIGVPCAEAED
jgi:hypothetical protein